MKNQIIIALVIFLIFGCSNKKINYLEKGKDILLTKTMDKNELLKAIEYFNLELKNNPNSVETLKNLAIAYSKISEEDKSFAELTKAIDQNNKIAEELFTLRGMQYFGKKNYEESISYYQKALSSNPTNKNIYKLIFTAKLWQNYNKDGKWEKFEKSDVQNLIDEVYAESFEKPTYEELISLYKTK